MISSSIVFATKTNHSKKLAEAIGDALNVVPINIKTNPRIADCDLLIVVGGIYGGVSSPELLNYLNALEAPYPRFAALVTNCASGKQTQKQARLILETKGISVCDEFVCKGAFLFIGLGHPNRTDMLHAKEFALNIANTLN
jgi:flavodoxin